jgi:antitoxin Phd
MNWQLQDAKARFSEVVDATLTEGPQVITRRGNETAVLVSYEEWTRMHEGKRKSLKELLLDPGNRFDVELPRRGRFRRRTNA